MLVLTIEETMYKDKAKVQETILYEEKKLIKKPIHCTTATND